MASSFREQTMTKATRFLIAFIAVAAWIVAAAAANAQNGAEPSIEGVWLSKVVVSVNPPVSIYSLNTFFAGGQAIEDTSTSTIRSVAHGEWVRVGSRQFVRTMYIFQYAPPHTFTGLTKVVNRFELNHAGDEF